jgi:DNA modification methylase
MKTVPIVRLSHLTPAQRRAYVLADNKLAQNAGWDHDLLAIELQGLIDIDFDLDLTGFEVVEIDGILELAAEKAGGDPAEDATPEPSPVPPVSRPGDIWILGQHRIICGDACEVRTYEALMAGEQAHLVFTDPPYNVRIKGRVSGLGAVKHDEFAMASGEMSAAQFTGFLQLSLSHMVSHCRDGAILFTCMDWRHMEDLLAAGHQVGLELKNLCVWNKDNGGMGSFYRSKHELVFVWKHGTAPHTNTFELGQHGRYRTNVWDYAGVNTLKRERKEELEMHPTVKPVALVADAIKDVSKRKAIALDPFSGSGTTIIAAEKTGRRARAIELDPKYVDVGVRRWAASPRFSRQPIRASTTCRNNAVRAMTTLQRPRRRPHDGLSGLPWRYNYRTGLS